MPNVRIPTQKRSIEKRERIIDKGFELMCNEGYHNVNTSDIAKYADVSTGIIYQYFNNKLEIFIEGAKKHSDKMMFPVFCMVDEKQKIDDVELFFRNLIHKFYEQYTNEDANARSELTTMILSYKEIASIFFEQEKKFVELLYNLFVNNGYEKCCLREKINIIVNMLNHLVFERNFFQLRNFDYEKMENMVVRAVNLVLLEDICNLKEKN